MQIRLSVCTSQPSPLVERSYHGVADLDVVAASTQFLKSYMPASWAIFERWSIGAIVTFHRLSLLRKVDILNGDIVQHYREMIPSQRDAKLVPVRWTINLLRWGHSTINPACQLRIKRVGVVAEIRHLDFHPIKRGIAMHWRAKRTAAVAPLTKLKLKLQNEVTVFPVAHEPRSARLAAVEDASLDL